VIERSRLRPLPLVLGRVIERSRLRRRAFVLDSDEGEARATHVGVDSLHGCHYFQ